MADMRQYAGGGVEAQQHRESASQYQQAQYARIAAPNTYQPLGGMAAQAEAAKAREEALRLGALPGVTHGAMQNVAYGSGGEVAMFKDRPLVDALCARLAGYCGEGGRNEGAVETLDRLLSEVRAARQGPTPPPERAVTLGEMCSGTDGRGDCEYRTGHAGPHSPSVPPSSPKGQRLNGLGLHRYQGVGAMLGSASGGPCPPEHLGIAQQLRAPGKMFSQETVLAVIRAQKVGPQSSDARAALKHLEHIFEEI